MWDVGFASRTFDAFEPGNVMLGWGYPEVVVRGVAMPLVVRAMVVRDEERDATLVYACGELCVVTWALRQGVLEALARREVGVPIDAHSLVLTATHTHSGPSGYSQFLMLDSPNGGFSEVIFGRLVDAFADAIVEAAVRREPAELRVASTEIPFEEPVAYNRSLVAFARNESARRVEASMPERATRRTSVTLRADACSDGRTIGLVNWFAVHATSLDASNRHIHPDNKGIAARLVERTLRARDDARNEIVAIFAQEASGDVSPRPRRVTAPPSSSIALRETTENGAIQARYALAAFEDARGTAMLEGTLGAVVAHVDLASCEVDPEFTDGIGRPRTDPSRLGIGFTLGTYDGPGPAHAVKPAVHAIARIARAMGVDASLGFVDLHAGSRGRLLGVVPARFVLPCFRFVSDARSLWASSACGFADRPWSPHVLPVQLARVGALRIAAVPGEPTTTAGERIRATLAADPSDTVIVNGYANAYAGYVATAEEYDLQDYEGGATQFGRHTLGAFRTVFRALDREPIPARGLPTGPPPLPADPRRLAQERCATSRKRRAIPFVSPSLPRLPLEPRPKHAARRVVRAPDGA